MAAKIGVQIVEKNLKDGSIHAVTGSPGNHACFPALTEETAIRLLKSEGLVGDLPIIRVVNGVVRTIDFQFFLADYVHE